MPRRRPSGAPSQTGSTPPPSRDRGHPNNYNDRSPTTDCSNASICSTIAGSSRALRHCSLAISACEPDDVPPIARGLIPDVTQGRYRVYPLVDHVADKIAATYERYGAGHMPSTRYRDLVDLVAIIAGASVDATSQRTALESEFARRHLVLPDHFDVPDRALWTPGYAAEARRSLLDTARTLDEALTLVRPFTDPLLQGAALGTWHPRTGNWA